MMPPDLALLRVVLDARHNELEDSLRQREALAVEHGVDMIDQVQHTAARDMAIYTLGCESVRLREVRAALHRLHLGTFGVGLDCKEEISLKRLVAVPRAALCFVSQEASDRSSMSPRNHRRAAASRRILNLAPTAVVPVHL